jgi:4-hydroxy-tetrahydrodipicolinate reductase
MSVLSILLAFYRQCCESSALKSLEPLKKRIDSLEQNAASAYTGKMPPVKQKEQPMARHLAGMKPVALKGRPVRRGIDPTRARRCAMKLALIGYGKMGVRIEEIAVARGHEIAAVIDPHAKEKTSRLGAEIAASFDAADIANNLGEADVAIEFTQPDSVVGNIRELSRRRIPAVIGTTNWFHRLDEVKRIIEMDGSRLLYAPNFSLGVNILYRIVSYAAQLMDSFPEYDVGGYEIHHNEKKESPSGTAKILVEKIITAMKRKKTPVWDALDRPPSPEEIHFSSLRVGAEPGSHAARFDSPADTIEIKHTARNRDGFALGAVRCAEWLANEEDGGVERRGVFTIDDFLEDV